MEDRLGKAPQMSPQERMLATVFGARFEQDPQQTLELKDPLVKMRQEIAGLQSQLGLMEKLMSGLSLEERIAFGYDFGLVGRVLIVEDIADELGLSLEETKSILQSAKSKVQEGLQQKNLTSTQS